MFFKKLLRILIVTVMVALIAAGVYAVIKAYFTIQVVGGVVCDGFGRPLYHAPFPIRWITSDWPGLLWWLLDIVISGILIGCVAGLHSLYEILRPNSLNKNAVKTDV